MSRPRSALRAGLVALFVTGLVVGVMGAFGENAVTLVPYVVYTAIGIVLTARRPDNQVGWLFLVISGLAGLTALVNGAVGLAAERGVPAAPYALVAAWVANMAWLPLLVASVPVTFLVFPDGAGTRWTRGLLRGLVVVTVLEVALLAFTPELTLADGTIHPNPLHPGDWSVILTAVVVVLGLLLMIGTVVAVGSVVGHYRRSRDVEREQLKWFCFAVVVCAAFLPATGEPGGHPLLGDLVFMVTTSLVPLACGLAILRYRLYDIDRIISRTASYTLVTALVVGVYALTVTATTRLLPTSSTLAVAAATLAAAAVARPLLHRVQSAVDRRFNRTRVDADQAATDFAHELRHETDQEAITSHLVGVVLRTVQPVRIHVWRP